MAPLTVWAQPEAGRINKIPAVTELATNRRTVMATLLLRGMEGLEQCV
jgi:hypothetical protein